MRKPKLIHPRKLIIPASFEPLPPQKGEEYFANGIFLFNITKMNEFIVEHHKEILMSSIDVTAWHSNSLSANLRDEYVGMADLTRPLVIAEIAPYRLEIYPNIEPSDWYMRGFSLLDGHHRIEKAYRQGIPAYFGRIRTLIPATSGQRFGIIRTA